MANLSSYSLILARALVQREPSNECATINSMCCRRFASTVLLLSPIRLTFTTLPNRNERIHVRNRNSHITCRCKMALLLPATMRHGGSLSMLISDSTLCFHLMLIPDTLTLRHRCPLIQTNGKFMRCHLNQPFNVIRFFDFRTVPCDS